MPDRSKQPEIKTLTSVPVNDLQKVKLNNNTDLCLIPGGEEEVFKLEIVFEAGNSCEPKPLMARYANELIFEGTKKLTSEEISRQFDYYGVLFNKYCDKDFAGFSIISLNKFAGQVIPFFLEILNEASFPVDEFQTLNKKQKQQFLINNKKVRFVAREKFFPMIFGNHPYAKQILSEDFEQIAREDVRGFYNKYYKNGKFLLFLSGRINDDIIDLINKQIAVTDNNSGFIFNEDLDIKGIKRKTDRSEVENAMQSAIRIGRPYYSMKHKDYIALKFVSTLLGGYFGSRLMNNIREDKGYTYGIGSNLISLKNSGYFFIATEVGSEFEEAAIKEIYYEIARLRDEKVPDEEMDLVKSYLTGSFMHSIDGPFNLAGNYKNIFLNNLSADYFEHLIETINQMSASQVQETANKYLDKKSLSELVAGNHC